MSIDVINVTAAHIKQLIVDLFNKINKVNSAPDLEHLSVEKLSDNKVMLQNPMSHTGVVFNKIHLNNLFPDIVTLRNFKEGLSNQAPILEAEHVDKFNTKHNRILTSVEMDILRTPTTAPLDVVKDFILFCRVFGFYELDIGDVTLMSQEGKLIISVNPTNKLFTGYIEVLV